MSMAEKQYAYGVARIRSRELGLLTGAFIEQLLAAKDEGECLRLLAEKGWSAGPSPREGREGAEGGAEDVLAAEREKT